jgi:hypothetical protein
MKKKKRLFPSKNRFEILGHEFTIKKVKLLRSKFKCTENDPRFATVHDEKNILHLISTHLKIFRAQRSRYYFKNNFCSSNEKSISLPCPRELVFILSSVFIFIILG